MDYGRLDEQVARLHPEIAVIVKRFVLLKIGNMRGIDLDRFDFDYDLTWAAMVFDDQGGVLGRFGGRDADTPGKYHSLKGLRYCLEDAWARFERGETTRPTPPAAPSKKVEEYGAAQRFSPKACFHCHNVAEFRREEKRAAGTWSKSDVWVFPEPEALGLSLDIEQGNRIGQVRPKSAAAVAGLRAGDVLRVVHGLPTASVVDVQYALHQAPTTGHVAVEWRRGGLPIRGEIALPKNWKQCDISWRWSLKSLKPGPQVQGEDLSAEEKSKLGLQPSQLAFRQGGFVSRAAQQAGVRIGDVIVGVDGRNLELTERQFETYMRLNYEVGAVVGYDILRGGQRLRIELKLPD